MPHPHETTYVVPFDDPVADQQPLVGGKAASLARLVRGGFAVPPGYVVTTSAYRAAITSNGLDQAIAEILGGIRFDDPEAVETFTAKIRDLIAGAEIPQLVRDEILLAYDRLGDQPFVAVRSSGTAEDLAEASFAGMHDTLLDIRGPEALLEAVRACWASMWTARATAYRQQNGFAHEAATLAVVVQIMVESEVSGVMFTANPVNARVDEIVINANWGLGESVVSGLVTPDEIVVGRDTAGVKRRTLGTKERQVVRGPDGGTVVNDVSAAQQRAWTLTDEQAAELATLGRTVSTYYGGFPQDVEWAFAHGEFYVLQSRPVTGVEFTWDEDIDLGVQVYSEDDDTVWTHSWADEYWTGAITPLFYSVREIEFGKIHRDWMAVLGFKDIEKMQYHKYRRATAYFNCKLDAAYYTYTLPPALRAGMLANTPPTWREETLKTPFDIPKYLRANARLALLDPDRKLFKWFKVMDDYMTNRVEEANGPTQQDWRRMSDDAIKKKLHELMMDLWVGFVGAEWCGFFLYAPGAFNLLGWMLANWYDGSNALVFGDLLTGLPQRTKTQEEGHVLWELATSIRSSDLLRKLFTDFEGAAFFAELENHEEGRAFLERYRTELLADHGHRGHADRDFYYPRRVEDPNIDYQAFRALLTAEGSHDPLDSERKLQERRELATAEVIENIRKKPLGALKAEVFKSVLSYAHRFAVLRDNERHWLDRITLTKKWAFEEMGRRLHERELIADPDDFYFLAIHELYDLLDGRAPGELSRAKIEARKRVFLRYLAHEEAPPAYIQHGLPVSMDGPGDADAGDGSLRGLGTSRGVATGRARVVSDLRNIGQVEQGDILVCNSTDPGWTPVFMVISGLVLETGGMLAHGSCLSREYGLPAVTVPSAMARIPDGATITVNGDTGEVIVYDAVEESELANPESVNS